MADEDYAYLQPDFDPSTLTVPRLRSILVAHSVAYPSSAKKPDLINLFNAKVAAQAKKIRAAQSNTKRTARGIVDVSPGGRPIRDASDELEEDDLAPLQTPAPRVSKRNGRASTEEVSAATPRTTRSTRQSTAPPTGTRASVKPPDNLDGTTDEIAVPKARKTRHSILSPTKFEQREAAPVEEVESPFTQDNPFQSGSPPPTERKRSGPRRRTTQAFVTDEEEVKAPRSSRRRTDGPFVDQYGSRSVTRTPRSEFPTVQIKQESDPEDEIAHGDSTADQQLELDTALAGESALARRPRRPRSGVAKAAPWSIFVALLGGFATIWRQEKLNVGYCGIGQPSTAIGGVTIPEWASVLQPQCEPCPQHAYCYANLHTVCEGNDFVLTPHPLSLGGLLPLPPTCEPDGEKARKIKAVADFAVDRELRERNAKFECGEIKTPEVPVEELKTAVASKRSKRMSDKEFDELWESALGEIMGREEVSVKSDGIALTPAPRPSSDHQASHASLSDAQSDDPFIQRLDSIFRNL